MRDDLIPAVELLWQALDHGRDLRVFELGSNPNAYSGLNLFDLISIPYGKRSVVLLTACGGRKMNTEVSGQTAYTGNISLLEYFEFVAATARLPHVRRLHSLYAAQEKKRLGRTDGDSRSFDNGSTIQAESEEKWI